jgi:hypothetical protein
MKVNLSLHLMCGVEVQAVIYLHVKYSISQTPSVNKTANRLTFK